MSTGKVAVFHGPGKPFELRELTIPEVEPDAVLIRVSLANVCGSDLHFWRGDAPLRLPADGWIFGHEMTGRVAHLGAKVKTDSLGRPLKEGEVFLIVPSGARKGPFPVNDKGVRVRSLEGGEYRVLARAEGLAQQRSVAVELIPGRESEVTVTLAPVP